MTTPLTLRLVKGAALTFAEADANFSALAATADAAATAATTKPDLQTGVLAASTVLAATPTAVITYINQAIAAALAAQMPAPAIAPGAVTGLTSGVATSTTQPLTWAAPTTGTAPITYAVGYRLTSAGGAYTVAATGISGTAYTVTGLSASTAYDYQVTPNNAVSAGVSGVLGNVSTAAPALDTRPGWFAAPSNAGTVNTAALIASRTILSGSANGGKAGVATLTTTGSNFAWFAVASASVPTFTDVSGGVGGFTAAGTFVDGNGTSWRLYQSSYPGSYTARQVTLS